MALTWTEGKGAFHGGKYHESAEAGPFWAKITTPRENPEGGPAHWEILVGSQSQLEALGDAEDRATARAQVELHLMDIVGKMKAAINRPF